MTIEKPTKQPNRLIPVGRWHEFHAWPSTAALRSYIYLRKRNGFTKALKRVGRRWLIDEAAFFAWVDEQTEVRRD